MADVITGSRMVFRINGVKVAHATTVSYNENIEYEPVDVLDNIATEEFVPTAYRVDFSVEMFRVADQSVKQLGLMPKLDDIFTSGDLTAEAVDRPTGKVLGLWTGVKLQSHSGSLAARAATRETLNFVAIRMKDESET